MRSQGRRNGGDGERIQKKSKEKEDWHIEERNKRQECKIKKRETLRRRRRFRGKEKKER